MHASKAARCVLADSVALLTVLFGGLVLSLIYHVPAPLSLLQILGIELLILVYPISILSRTKSSAAHSHLRFEALTFGMLAALMAYGSFLLTFGWQGLSPVRIDTTNSLYRQAVTVAFISLALCQLVNLLLVRSGNRSALNRGLWNNRQLVRSLAVASFVLLNVVYNPVLHAAFGTTALQPLDWLTVLIAVGSYTSFRHMQRHTHRHSCLEVVALHRELQES